MYWVLYYITLGTLVEDMLQDKSSLIFDQAASDPLSASDLITIECLAWWGEKKGYIDWTISSSLRFLLRTSFVFITL